jgi:host factor-I protein
MPFYGYRLTGRWDARAEIGPLSIMSAINVQESFLNVALTGGKNLTVHLLNGAKVSGSVRSFDKYSIVLETNTQEQLIFKHSVSAMLVCCKNKQCTERCQSGPAAPKTGK